MALRAVVGAGLITGLSGCFITNPEEHPSGIQTISGGLQTVAVNAVAPKPLTVKVQNQDQDGMGGVEVVWEIKSGAGSISSTSTKTDDDGETSVTFTAGATTGKTVVVARMPAIGAASSFTITVQ